MTRRWFLTAFRRETSDFARTLARMFLSLAIGAWMRLKRRLLIIVGVSAVTVSVAQIPSPPYPRSPVIDRVEFDFQTHRRLAPGSDNWPTTWANDGHLYSVWGDGGGFGGTNSKGRVLLGVARIEGGPNDYIGRNL